MVCSTSLALLPGATISAYAEVLSTFAPGVVPIDEFSPYCKSFSTSLLVYELQRVARQLGGQLRVQDIGNKSDVLELLLVEFVLVDGYSTAFDLFQHFHSFVMQNVSPILDRRHELSEGDLVLVA